MVGPVSKARGLTRRQSAPGRESVRASASLDAVNWPPRYDRLEAFFFCAQLSLSRPPPRQIVQLDLSQSCFSEACMLVITMQFQTSGPGAS